MSINNDSGGSSFPAQKTFLLAISLVAVLFGACGSPFEEDWLQYKFDERHSGNAFDRDIQLPLGLLGTVPLSDAVFTSPVVADSRVYVVDGSGVAFCIDAETLDVVWRFESRGGAANCNNVSSPAIIGPYLHFGTVAGSYYVLDRRNGDVV